MTAVLAGAVGISFAAIFAKKAMQHDVDAMASAFWRLTLSIPIFACLAMPAIRRGVKWTLWLLVPAVCFGLDLLTWHLAFKYTTAGMSTLLANVSAVFVGVGAWWWLKERLDWRWAVGAALAMAGVAGLAFTAAPGSGASNPLLGNMLSLLTALCYAAYLLAAKRMRDTVPASVIMLCVVVGAPIVLLAGVFVGGESLLPGTPHAWVWLVLLAIVPQTLGQGLVIFGLRGLPAAFSAIVLLVQPVATTIWGGLFLGESLGPWELGLGTLVLVGIVFARLGTGGTKEAT